ncbi:radical SAM protein [Puniceicoccaceae bacterium K14]|nr:radical SAM protein [Puniceicoccaceae bacterium K14]
MGRVHVYQDIAQICMDRLEAPLKLAERVDITGVGEPLLSKTFWSFIKTHKKQPGQYIRLNSNGLLLTEENAPIIANSAASEISISFDASQTTTYKKIRGGNFERAKQGVKALVEARNRVPDSKLDIYINMTLMKENVSELEGLVRIGKELGVDRVVAYQLFSFGDSPVWVVERGDWTFKYSEQMLKHYPEYAAESIRAAVKTSKEIGMRLDLLCKTKEYIENQANCSA